MKTTITLKGFGYFKNPDYPTGNYFSGQEFYIDGKELDFTIDEEYLYINDNGKDIFHIEIEKFKKLMQIVNSI